MSEITGFTAVTGEGLTIASTLKPTALVIGKIRIDLKTGNVTLPEDMSVDEASRQFWDAVKKFAPIG